MKKLHLLKTMLLLCALIVGSGTMWGDKVTDYTNIVSGSKYYIGATTGGTDYYLSVASDIGTGVAGTAVTSKVSATMFTFEGSGTSWTIKFDNGNYLSLASSKANGKVNIQTSSSSFTASNQSSKIRLSIGSYSIQKNNNGTQFGSYGNTQTDLWLELATTDLAADDFKWSGSSYTATIGASNTFPTLTNTQGVTVSYQSTNEDAATIDSDGNISLVAAGETTIKAVFAGNSTYNAKTVSYDLTVLAAGAVAAPTFNKDNGASVELGTEVTINAPSNDCTLKYQIGDGEVVNVNTYTANVTMNTVGAVTLKAWAVKNATDSDPAQISLTVTKHPITPSFAPASVDVVRGNNVAAPDLSGNTGNGTVTYASGDTDIATVDENTGEVTGVAVGSTTITATIAATDTYLGNTATFTVNVTKPAHTVTFYANGSELSTADVVEDESIVFPNVDDIGSKKCVGWLKGATIDGTTDSEPDGLVTSANMGTADVAYYAVYALETEEESEIIKSYGFETTEDANWTISGPVRDNSSHNSGSYAGKINTNNSYVTFKNKVKVTEFSFAFTRTSGNANYNVYIETSTNNSTWTAVETYAMSTFNSDGTYTTKTKTFDGNEELYVRFHCNNTTAVRYVDDVTIKYTAQQTTRSAYCTTVADVTGVTLNKDATTLVVGETETLTATVAPADAGNKNVSWTTSNADVATVANGVVTGVAAGTATITVTTEQGSKTATCTVTVKNAHGLAYAEVAQTAKYGESFTAPTLTNPNELTVTYASSNSDVATVDTKTGEVTIKTVGETTITATFAGNETYINGSAAYTLTVNKGDAGLTFPEATYSVVYGNEFEAPTLSNPNSLTVAYESDDTDVATVDAKSGAVTVVGYGTTTITASTEGSAIYAAGETSYTLNVTKSINTISNINDSYTLDVETADAKQTFAATATNGTVSYEVYNDGTTLSEEDVDFLLDGSDLTISKNKKGVVKIRAYVAESANYETVEKIITVYAQDAPSFTEAADQVMDYEDTYTVVVDTDGEVTLTSSTPVATVAGMVVTANAVGEATITVNCAAGLTTKAGSKTFDILVTAPAGSDEAPASEVVVFNETFAECESTGGNSGGFATASNTKITDEDSYTDNDGWSFTNGYPANSCAKFGGSSSAGSATSPSITVESGKTYKLSFKAAPWNTEASKTMTVTVTGGAINSEASATTSSMTAGQWNDFEFDIVASSTSLQLEFSCSANRFFLDEVKVTKSAPSTATVTLNKYGYATYCSQYPMDFTSTTGYTAWRVNSVSSDGTITFKKITEKIKGGQGVLLYNKNADSKNTTNVTVNFADGSTIFDNGSDGNGENDNLFVGTTAKTYVAADDYYGLKGDKFVPVTSAGTVPTGKALLPATAIPASAREFNFVFLDEEATSIRNLIPALSEGEGAVYDLQGRKVAEPKKGGLYIVNGRKVVIK